MKHCPTSIRLNPHRRVWIFIRVLLIVSALLPEGCKTMETVTQLGTAVGVATGAIDESQAQSIQKSATAVARSFEDFTPEQEYYIGRTVGAVIVNKF